MKVEYQGANTYAFYLNGDLWYTKTLYTWTPNSGQFYGEVTSLGTQMMGSRSLHVSFSSNRIKYGSPTAWHNLSGVLWSSNTTYFKYTGNAANFEIWDNTCAS